MADIKHMFNIEKATFQLCNTPTTTSKDAMQANNKSKAESYLRRQRSHAEKALRRIREDPDRSLQMGVNYTKSNHQIDGRRQLLSRSDRGMSDLKEERQVDGHEWDAIMNRIFLEKFF